MKRTLAQARRMLEEDLAPNLNDRALREHRRVLEEAEANARRHADQFVSECEAEARSAWDAAVRELSAVRDALDQLAAEGATGRVSAEEYTARLGHLRARQEEAEAELDATGANVDAIERIEGDPAEWFDDLASHHPILMPEFPW